MHRIAFVVFPNFQVMGFAAITAFELANRVLRDIAYGVTLVSETGFADRERMRRAFLRTVGQPPLTVRRNARLI